MDICRYRSNRLPENMRKNIRIPSAHVFPLADIHQRPVAKVDGQRHIKQMINHAVGHQRGRAVTIQPSHQRVHMPAGRSQTAIGALANRAGIPPQLTRPA